MSHEMPEVRTFASPPPIGSVYRSPSRSNTIVLPSGLTSRLIHVPSSVSIATSFVGPGGCSTSHFGFFFFSSSPSFAVASAAGAGRNASAPSSTAAASG
jgi:hypothetical protein